MSEKVIATIEKEPLEKTKFYTMHRVHQKNNPDSLLKFIIVFNLKAIKSLRIESSITSNREIFTKCSELIDGLNLHKIKKEQEVSDKNELNVFINPYLCRLSEHAKNQDINEAQSLEIMKEVVEALYCVYKNKYRCYNVRAENFVLIQLSSESRAKKINSFRCKLQSLPFDPDIKYIASPYTWNDEYQPPEAYDHKLSTEQLKESLVWSIGCLWLHILYGRHLLDNLENIKKFCQGSGRFGVYNVQSLGCRQKLSKENQQLLQKMLNYFPNNRLTLNQVFEQKLFDQLISVMSPIVQNFQNKNSSCSSEVKNCLKQSWDKQFIKYQSSHTFFLHLVQIISQKDFPLLAEQSIIIKKATKDLPSKEQKNTSNEKKTRKNYPFVEPNNVLTLQKLKNYLRPYKFYNDKTIFLSNCSIYLMKTIRQHCKQPMTQVQSPLLDTIKPIYDEEITFLFGILSMKLIYLQILSQNLNLHQNVFNIQQRKHKKNNVYRIDNCIIDNDNQQWIQFRLSGIYQALKYFINSKLSECDKQFQLMLQKYNCYCSYPKKISSVCCKMISNIFDALDYKSCTVRKFLPFYQKILKDTIQKIDTYNVTNKQKYVGSVNLQDMYKQMSKIGYIEAALFIESQAIFAQKHYEDLFGRYYEMQTISINRQSLQSNNSYNTNKRLNNETKQKFIVEKQNDIFSFKTLQLFFRLGDPKIVHDQVKNLLSRFIISFNE